MCVNLSYWRHDEIDFSAHHKQTLLLVAVAITVGLNRSTTIKFPKLPVSSAREATYRI
jgi:hypothetical protein